jgi:hypothetical protein
MGDEKRVLAVLILFTVAIVGYLVGRGASSARSPEAMREATNAVTTVNYSSASGWRVATSQAPAIPGLSIAQPLILAPQGDTARGGLVVGQLTDTGSSPLPAPVLERLHESPATDVVSLLNTQAYRYSQLSVAGWGHGLTLFTIPQSATATTGIVCYAPTPASSELRACERLAGTLTISTGKPRVEVRAFQPLTPQATYGRQISAALAKVNSLLAALRPEIRPGVFRANASSIATRASEGLAGASESIAAIKPPPAAAQAHAAITVSVGSARAAYAALGNAVNEGNTAGYTVARSQIYAAEAGLSTAVRNLTLLGYQ